MLEEMSARGGNQVHWMLLTEPEKSDGKNDRTDNHWRESLFRDSFPVFLVSSRVVCCG